ncbi:hypothetical protein [Mycoplasma sp. HF14]
MITEKNLENKIKRILKNNGINYFKLFSNGIQGAGLADLWVFNHFTAYAMEIKRNFKRNQPTKLQVAKAREFSNNVIYIFIDEENYKEILPLIIKNDAEKVKEISQHQLEEWSK